MRRKLALFVAVAAAALALAGIASAGTPVQTPCPVAGPVVDCAQITVGNAQTATVTVGARASQSPTTAFAIGVWSSLEVAAPVTVNYAVECQHPINSRSGSTVLTAGRFFSDATYIWTGSPLVAGPWYGWDVCETTVTMSQASAGTDHSLVGWLASHR